MHRHSVVIVGAGPGGGAAAITLAQHGVTDVLLVDKDEFPREKTCGSALSPNGVAMLEQLGVGEQVRRLGYIIDGMRLGTPGGRQMVFRSEQAAVILLRKHFDNLLVERARSLGVRFRPGLHARELIVDAGRVVGVRTKEGEEIHASHVVCADGAHSIFSRDPRPRRTISTLMGWWEGFPFEPHTLEMIFDPNLAPFYGWMFPESAERVNIGICMDGDETAGPRRSRNVRDVFERFLDDHFSARLRGARPNGRWKGHPISYTTFIDHLHAPGVVYLGEAARITHNATGEGIYQALQSGTYAGDAIAAIHRGAKETRAMARYARACRRRFTGSFLAGHLVRGLVQTPILDGLALVYNDRRVRSAVTWALGSALTGSHLSSRRDGTTRVAPASQASAS
jgi:menaquinone-9 beta-reductase